LDGDNVIKKRSEYRKPELSIHGDFKEITKGDPIDGGEAENQASL